ncbi:MAG TPA: hypothetical protein VGK22_07380 [Candidatus Angelobacter sp.]|jgi:hypothetical protein
MKCWVLSLAFAMLFGISLASAADGTFIGKVVDPPANAPTTTGWIFIQGRNNMLRRVEVSHAEILFGEDVPVDQRHKCTSKCLSPGQEVRVTAHQDSSGEWQAKRVEILKIANKMAGTTHRAETFSSFDHFFASPQITNVERFCIAPSTEKSN